MALEPDQHVSPRRRGDRAQQPSRIRVPGPAEHLAGGAKLDEPPRVYDSDAVGQLADHGNRAKYGSSQASSICEMKPGTNTRSTGPSPNAWQAMFTSRSWRSSLPA